jgi:Ca2+-binding EF-hand superfamily protein
MPFVCAQDELQGLMAIADVDGDGLIDYNEVRGAGGEGGGRTPAANAP